MEMPVPCSKCGEWIELNDTRESDISKELVCSECYDIDREAYELKEEIVDLQLDLDNEPEYMKGQRREYKKEIKEKKARIVELGYSFEDLMY